jgi:hypothetical protein
MKSKVLDQLVVAQRAIAERLEKAALLVSDEDLGQFLLHYYSHCPVGCGTTVCDAKALVLMSADRPDFLGRYGDCLGRHFETHPECGVAFNQMEYVEWETPTELHRMADPIGAGRLPGGGGSTE